MKSNKERKVILEYGAITLYGAPFQGASFNNPFEITFVISQDLSVYLNALPRQSLFTFRLYEK